MTPRARSSGVSCARKLYATRNLNAPPRWSISGLTNTCAPSCSESESQGSVGVRTATGAIRAAAASRSFSVMRSVTGLRSSEDTIAAGTLCLVQRPVGFLEQHLGRDGIGAARERDADGNREPHWRRLRAEVEVVHLAPKSFGKGERALPPCVGEHDDEFVAT